MLPGSKREEAQLVVALHHVQLAMPAGEEEAARAFYSGVLGFEELEKPEHLKQRGGCWFRSGEVDVHLGVDREFKSAKKAHPAFIVDSLDRAMERLSASGCQVDHDTQIFGFNRFYSTDPFGNRLEFLEQIKE